MNDEKARNRAIQFQKACFATMEQIAAGCLEEKKIYTAQINGDRMECGKCGAWLQKVIERGKGTVLEIKCKSKHKSHTCNAINRIEL
jgi:hypothetical protein